MYLCFLLAHVTMADPSSLVIQTEFGKVAGVRTLVNGVNINSWLGVPFAAAPVGDLRWKPPTNPQSWDVKLAAASFLCPQRLGTAQQFLGDEKTCLQANIWVPEVATGKPINTVLVWIHGGGNTNTLPSEPVFDGSKLVARSTANPADQSEPVIMVAIGYRMGGLGFMAMPELTAESSHKSSGNYGLLDQIFALKWIKRNIHAFGASKTPRLVVFGESAGAYDISTLLASPLATGLFDGAIMESTYQAFYWKKLKAAQKTGTSCAAKHKCQLSSANATLACLRALTPQDAYDCTAGNLKPVNNNFELLTTPNVDGYVLKCNPLDALQASGSTRCGKLSQAPIMVGSSLMEGNLFTYDFVSPTLSWGTSVQSVGLTAARSIVDLYQSPAIVDPTGVEYAAEALYPVEAEAEVARKLTQAFSDQLKGRPVSAINATIAEMLSSDLMFTCSAHATANAVASQRSPRNAYLYLFNHTPTDPYLALLGPTHTSEMPYIFGTFEKYTEEIKGTPGRTWISQYDMELSKTMMDYWLNFARYLNPNNPTGNSTWPAATCGDRNDFMVFGDRGAVASFNQKYRHIDQCSWWRSFTGLGTPNDLNSCSSNPGTTASTTKIPKIAGLPVNAAVGVGVLIIILVAGLVAGIVFFVLRQKKQTKASRHGQQPESDELSYKALDE